MRTRQKRVATDTWRYLGCRTTPLENWSKRKPTVEPQWAKQQTKKLRPKPTKINSFMPGAIIESDARPTGVQLKRETKLLTGLNTKHADCRIIFEAFIENLFIWSRSWLNIIKHDICIDLKWDSPITFGKDNLQCKLHDPKKVIDRLYSECTL